MDEHLMSVTKTQTPKILTGAKAEEIAIIRLILMEPGLYETHPKMGVGLVSKYRYKDIDEIQATLPDAIRSQMRTYMPMITNPEVVISFYKDKNGSNIIKIGITSEELTTVISVDEETRQLVSLI